MRASGNTVLMTGGGSGIGEALAHRLHDRGDRVIVAGRRREALERAAQGRPGVAIAVLDVDDPAGVADFTARVLADHPDLNVLVNNAGVMRLEPIDRARDLSAAEETIRTNLLGPIRLIDAFVEHLAATPDAAIINVTSGLAFVPLIDAAVYSATKAAIHSYTASLRAVLEGRVSVIELAPPGVQTDLTPGQATRPGYMPLDDFADEIMALLAGQPVPDELLVERVRPLRHAERDGQFAERLTMLNQSARAARAAQS